jgi:RNA polymerase sigma-70 factor (ECF subfamily)
VPNQVQDTAAVAAYFEQGRAAWPGISISLDDFARRARELAVTESGLAERAAELVLAFACAAGDPVALGWFDTRYLSAVATYVSRFNLGTDLLDEVRQRVRIKQLLGVQPGIARYNGRGALGAWVRV